MPAARAGNLGRLARYGFKIPRGAVLSARAYTAFIRRNKLEELVANISGSNPDEARMTEKLAQLQREIQQGHMPRLIMEELARLLESGGLAGRPLAVRSSAVSEDAPEASFAGIHDSFLNINGGPDDVLTAVKGCYASLWSPRAVAYRRKMNIPHDGAGAAVVLMEMVEARAAGVGFTCDPRSGRQDLLVISANFGLGESVVTGAVEPDTYFLDARPWTATPRLIEQRVGRKEGVTLAGGRGSGPPGGGGGTRFVRDQALSARQVLTRQEAEGLGLLLLRVLDALGDGEQHQDVEWVFDGRDFILVQARPVTALPRHTFAALKDQPDIWSNGNYRDAVPMVQSPLNRSLSINIIDTIHEASYTRIGYPLPEGLRFSKFFNGRLYANIAALQWAWYDSMGMLPRDVNNFWGGHQPEIEIPDPEPLKGPMGQKRLARLHKSGLLMNEAVAHAENTFARLTAEVKALIQRDPGQLQDRDFPGFYDELSRTAREFALEFRFLSGSGAPAVGSLFQVLARYFGDRAAALFNNLMVGGDAAITSADHGYRLMELAAMARRDSDAAGFFADAAFAPRTWEERLPEDSPFKQGFREFIGAYGHRAVYELDIINPRWREDPSYLLDIIRSTVSTADPGKLRSEQRKKYQQAWREIEEKVPFPEHAAIKNWLKEAQAGAAVREMTKSVTARAIEVYRMMALELGRRFCSKGLLGEQADIFFCTWPEVFSLAEGAWDSAGLRELVAERKTLMRKMEAVSPPDIIVGDTPRYTHTAAPAPGGGLRGVAVAAGKAEGPARLVHHPDQGNRLQPGDVLVAPSTDPAWTPLFLIAGAVLMETGGFMSHGAIVAREYGIPAVVNIPGLMKVLVDGQKVVVDGDEGAVFIQQ